MLFDFSSMQPPEQIRAVDAAIKFLGTQMTTSDLVSIMIFGSELKTVLDFTGDRDLLISTLQRLPHRRSERAGVAWPIPAPIRKTRADRSWPTRPSSISSIPTASWPRSKTPPAAWRTIPEKKALVYISSGVQKTGVDNQSQLHATVNAAVRANVAFYPIDARGLMATAPGGDASQAGAVGSNLYSGSAQTSLRDSFHNQQETLDHAGGRHRRQGAARFQRSHAGHDPGAAGYRAATTCSLMPAPTPPRTASTAASR